MTASHPRALKPPEGSLVVLSRAQVDAAAQVARASSRQRVILPLHKSEAEPLQRMFNVIQPDSYVRPHRHVEPPLTESWVLLHGAAAFFTFEDDGRVRDCIRLEAGGDLFGVDMEPGPYHGLVALEPDTVLFEAKQGPYAPANTTTFAPFAPAEGTPEAREYQEGLRAEFQRRQSTDPR